MSSHLPFVCAPLLFSCSMPSRKMHQHSMMDREERQMMELYIIRYHKKEISQICSCAVTTQFKCIWIVVLCIHRFCSLLYSQHFLGSRVALYEKTDQLFPEQALWPVYWRLGIKQKYLTLLCGERESLCCLLF